MPCRPDSAARDRDQDREAAAAEAAALVERAYGSARRSPQREVVARAVESIAGAFSVEDLLAATRGLDASVGSATVYRAVAAMAGHGYLEQVGERDGSGLYVRCSAQEHHHHLVCTGCGSVAHAPCPLDEYAIRHAAKQGFVITRHEVSVYGLCAACLRDGVPR